MRDMQLYCHEDASRQGLDRCCVQCAVLQTLAAAVNIRTQRSVDGEPRGQPLSNFSLYKCGWATLGLSICPHNDDRPDPDCANALS